MNKKVHLTGHKRLQNAEQFNIDRIDGLYGTQVLIPILTRNPKI